VAPIADAQNDYALDVAKRLRAARLRVEVDQRSERLDRKIRDAKLKKVPYIAVVGREEVGSGQVNVQDRAGKKVGMALESFVDMITAEVAERRR
jgi:threonyl-tRNA synthetase